MIEQVIEKLKEENLKLKTMLDDLNNEKNFVEILIKILNNTNITDNELNEAISYLESYEKIDSIDKETIMFTLVVLVPNNEKFEKTQIEAIKKVISQYTDEPILDISRNMTTNSTLIDKLSCDEVFIYIDDLDNTLVKYGFSSKDRLKVISELIKKNFSVKIIDEEKKEISDNVEEVVQEVKEESIQTEDSSTDVEEVKITCSNEIMNLFKKNKLFYDKLEDSLKLKINEVGINVEEVTYIFDYLKKIKFNIKNRYSEVPEDIVNVMMYATKENLDKLINICDERHISLKSLINSNIKILYGMYFDNFISNIEFLDFLGYDYSNGEKDKFYTVPNFHIVASYKIYTQVYKLTLTDANFSRIFGFLHWNSVLDRLIEFMPNYEINNLISEIGEKIFERPSAISFKVLKECIKKLKSTESIKDDGKKLIKLINALDYEINVDIVKEENEFYEDLNSNLIQLYDMEGNDIYVIPYIETVHEEILENEYIDYLEQNYKKGNFIYKINDTKVSRIKVLRAINYLTHNGIEITKDVVLYALKLNYIYIDDDLENINNAFSSMVLRRV